MNLDRYISEFLNVPSKKIDDLDEFLLWHILKGYTSSYKLWRLLQEQDDPMAYKNVNQRIRQLRNVKLIEEIKKSGGYKHGAINYRLTSRGLMYLFSELITPKNLNEVVRKYPQNSLFKLFIYDFFEDKTLELCTFTLECLLQDYIEECCQKIRLFVDSSLVDYYQAREDYLDPGNVLKHVLVHQLEWHKRSFILKVATLNDDLIDWRSSNKPKRTIDDRDKTLDLLANDKRFMNALEEYGGEFIDGYKKLIELKNRSRK